MSILRNKKNTLYEKSNISTTLTRIEKLVKSYKDILSDLDYDSNVNRINYLRIRLEEQCKKIIQQKISTIENQVKEVLDSGTYLVSSKKKECLSIIDTLESELNHCSKSLISDIGDFEEIEKLENFRKSVQKYNTDFVRLRKKNYIHLWSNGNFTLDDEQQTAIITDDKHNLVVAAAGSGKTEVLITRIAYIVKRQPDFSSQERILAIAYQRKAREEIEKRLVERYGLTNINVSTFHKLGKDILEHAGNKYFHTDIVDENKKHEIIDGVFHQKIDNDPEFYNLFLDFVKELNDDKEKEDEQTKDEVLSYAKERSYYSLNKTRVKSKAEKEIMNFFLTYKLNEKNIKI